MLEEAVQYVKFMQLQIKVCNTYISLSANHIGHKEMSVDIAYV
jgi:hypothetical protein